MKRQKSHIELFKAISWYMFCCTIWWFIGAVVLLVSDKVYVHKFVNDRHTPFQDMAMPMVTYLGTAPVIIVVGLLLYATVQRFRKPGFLALFTLCNIIPFLVCQSIKRWINAPRPLRYFEKAEWMNLIEGQPELMAYSFPSGHTAGAFAFFCFLSLLLTGSKKWLGLIFFALAILVGYSRIYLSQHFFDDVYAGSILGTFTCIGVFMLLYKRPFFNIDEH
jgi:membrane-associated phospholipid phosphatase